MASKSFCLEDAGKETKSLPTAPENHSLTPVAYKSSPKKQEREFLQLYIKARAGSQPTQTLRLQHNSLSAERTRKNRDENEYGNESQSPKTAGKSLGKKAILRNIDINNIPNTFTPDKPSRFKLNHEFNAGGKEQVEEVKVSSFNPSYRNHNVSLHDIEFKDGNNFANYAASIEILLPDLKEKESDGLETQNIQSHVNVTELEQEQQRREYEQQTQQQHQNESHQIQTQSHEQAIEIRNTRSTSNRIVFGHNVEAAYSKVFKVYLIWLLSYGVLLGFNFGVLPYFIVFMFAFIIESYFIYEICKKDSNQLFDPVNEKRKLNTSAQIISIIVLEILGLIKLSGFDFPLSIATIPIFITTVFSCYLFNTGDRRNSNALTVIFQTLLSLQILTICLKIDNVLQWSWQGAFWVSWASLVVVVFYCVGLFMMFLFFLCFEGSNISRSYQLVGLAWILTTLAGYVGVAFFLLYGFTDRLEYGSDQDKITKALIGGVSHVIFLAAYTWLAKTKIKKFLRRIVRADVQVEQETKPEVRFEKATEGLPSYIIRFTPSYFLTFDDSLKIKDGLKLRNIKKKVSLMKSYQYSRFVSGKFWKKKDSRDNLPLVENGINHETNDLHPNNLEDIVVKPIHPQIKRILPHRANVSETGSPANLKSKPKDYGSEAKKKFGRAEEELNTEEDRNEKLCFSANDLDFMQKIEVDDFLSEVRTPLNLNKKTFSEKEEDKACIICCDKFPDAVVMSCGHGGICYECALESWKKSQECFMCRAKIDKVLHIDTHKLGKFNMTKVLSATKLVKDRPRREGYQERENFADTMYIARNHI